jgi:hypothetical protein
MERRGPGILQALRNESLVTRRWWRKDYEISLYRFFSTFSIVDWEQHAYSGYYGHDRNAVGSLISVPANHLYLLVPFRLDFR